MSRIGKLPIEVPAGVSVSLDGSVVNVKGPKGALSRSVAAGISVLVEGNVVRVLRQGSGRQIEANHGTIRAIIQRMVTGVATGWKRNLEMTGVGFGAKLIDGDLVLNCGFSHEVRLRIPEGVSCAVGKTSIEVVSCCNEQDGQFASSIRSVQPPEPYLGKGIRYSDEVVRRKAGKTGKK
jgi:large subunit ribosomal protein L6